MTTKARTEKRVPKPLRINPAFSVRSSRLHRRTTEVTAGSAEDGSTGSATGFSRSAAPEGGGLGSGREAIWIGGGVGCIVGLLAREGWESLEMKRDCCFWFFCVYVRENIYNFFGFLMEFVLEGNLYESFLLLVGPGLMVKDNRKIIYLFLY